MGIPTTNRHAKMLQSGVKIAPSTMVPLHSSLQARYLKLMLNNVVMKYTVTKYPLCPSTPVHSSRPTETCGTYHIHQQGLPIPIPSIHWLPAASC